MRLEYCKEIISEVMSSKYSRFASPFYEPVDPVALGIPDYLDIIKCPMDLGTIKVGLSAQPASSLLAGQAGEGRVLRERGGEERFRSDARELSQVQSEEGPRRSLC